MYKSCLVQILQVFRVSSYLLSVVFCEMINMEQNQNTRKTTFDPLLCLRIYNMVKGFSHFYPKDDTFPDFSRFPCYSAASSKFWIFARLQKKKKKKKLSRKMYYSQCTAPKENVFLWTSGIIEACCLNLDVVQIHNLNLLHLFVFIWNFFSLEWKTGYEAKQVEILTQLNQSPLY